MLQFFRRYQKIFFFIVTLIIISTFVFFGTFQAFTPQRTASDEVMFEAIDGTKVRRGHHAALTRFLAEEGGPINFLNSGIVSKNFLETKFGELLFAKYQESFKADFEERASREKSFSPYVHPQARVLAADTIWGLFAPDLKENLAKLQAVTNPYSLEGFRAKQALYLAERRFPSELLSQVLRNQEMEYPGIYQDPKLGQGDGVTLFGYHNLQDWFGKSYMDKVTEVIINGSIVASQRGLKVTREEVMADLLHKSEKAFESYKDELPPQISNAKILLAMIMREKGFDEETLCAVWQQVMLFGRLMDEVSASVVIDALAMKEFYSEAHEKIALEIYQLPEEFRFQNNDDLKAFEVYLNALQSDRGDILTLPTKFDSVEEIEKRFPELVAYPFLLEVKKASKKDLQARITVKETWEWEEAEKNWARIQDKFPQLQRSAIDKMERKPRAELDQFARAEIVNEHPEWLDEALEGAKSEERRIAIRLSSKVDLKGIKENHKLKEILEKEDEIAKYTQDDENYYRFKVKERGAKEILSFIEAKESEILKKDETTSCTEVVKAIRAVMEKEGDEELAPYRFLSYMKSAPLKEGFGLAKQWNLEKKEETVSRGSKGLVSFDEAKALEKDQISKVFVTKEEGAYFFKVVDKTVDTSLPLDKMIEAQEMLSKEAREHFFENELLGLIDVRRNPSP